MSNSGEPDVRRGRKNAWRLRLIYVKA